METPAGHRFVLTPAVALTLAERRARLAPAVRLVAPTLLRSQVLSLAYRHVHEGRWTPAEARKALDYVRGLRIRLLGDRVLQDLAWKVAAELAWTETFDAEYIALTQLQADALVTDDPELAAAAARFVAVVPVDRLLG